MKIWKISNDLRDRTMILAQNIKSGFRNYANFSGRATPSEFWYWLLFVVVLCGLPILATLILDPLTFNIARSFEGEMRGYWFGINDAVKTYLPALSIGLGALLLLPTLAVAARRSHDLNSKGWICLLLLLPGINFYVLFGYMSPGKDEDNQFGPSPY